MEIISSLALNFRNSLISIKSPVPIDREYPIIIENKILLSLSDKYIERHVKVMHSNNRTRELVCIHFFLKHV